MKKLEARLKIIARDCGVVDLKWSQVRTRENKLRAGGLFLEAAVEAMAAKEASLEIITWEAPEARDALKSREDKERLYLMYARLLKRSGLAWPNGSWVFHPDARTGMEWKRILSEANGKGRAWFKTCRPQASKDSVLVQLADLAAGMARTLKEKSADFSRWRETGSLSLKPGAPGRVALENRFAISADFVENCRRRGLKPFKA